MSVGVLNINESFFFFLLLVWDLCRRGKAFAAPTTAFLSFSLSTSISIVGMSARFISFEERRTLVVKDDQAPVVFSFLFFFSSLLIGDHLGLDRARSGIRRLMFFFFLPSPPMYPRDSPGSHMEPSAPEKFFFFLFFFLLSSVPLGL